MVVLTLNARMRKERLNRWCFFGPTYLWTASKFHLSIAEFGLNRQGKLKPFSFKFDLLMRQWRYGIISLLRTHYPVLILPPEL